MSQQFLDRLRDGNLTQAQDFKSDLSNLSPIQKRLAKDQQGSAVNSDDDVNWDELELAPVWSAQHELQPKKAAMQPINNNPSVGAALEKLERQKF